MDSRVALRGSTLVTASFLYFYYRPYWTHDSGVAHAGGVVSALKKDQISGLCFGLADVLALIPQAVGGQWPKRTSLVSGLLSCGMLRPG